MAVPKKIKQNKVRPLLRTQITNLLEDNWYEVQAALAEIKETDPAKYIEYYLKMIEYVVPKLRAIDTTINTGDSISNITIEVKKPTLSDEMLLDAFDNLSNINVLPPPSNDAEEIK